MLNLVIIALLSAALPEVEVQTVEGEQFAGTLVEWKAERLVLKTEDGQRSLSADELSALAPRHPSTADLAVGKVEVQLVDGSSFSASQYTARAGTAAVVLPGGRKLSVPGRLCRPCACRAQEPRLARSGSESSRIGRRRTYLWCNAARRWTITKV